MGRQIVGRTAECPMCGAELTMPTTEERTLYGDARFAIAVVVTDPGTVHRHVRDEHPEKWAELCEAQRKMNANPFIGGSPRKVDGTFLRAGEDVGTIAAIEAAP